MVNQAKGLEDSPKLTRKQVYIISFFAAVLLLIANSAIWANRYIFDSENFADVTTEAVTSQRSRDAIASAVTDRIFEDRPVAQQLLGNNATSLISGLLDSDRFGTAINNLASLLEVYSTTEDQQNIALELSEIKPIVARVVNAVDEDRAAQLEQRDIPDEIVLINADEIPDLYSYSVVLLWLGPLALVGALVLLALPYVRNKNEWHLTLLHQATALAVVSLLAFVIGPLFKPPILSMVSTAEGRIIVETIYNSFIATFNSQTVWLFILALAGMVVAGWVNLRQKVAKY